MTAEEAKLNTKANQGLPPQIRLKKRNRDMLYPYPILELHGNLVFRVRHTAGVKAITGICTGFTTFIIDGEMTFSGQRGHEWYRTKERLLKEGWRPMKDYYIEVDREWVLGMLKRSEPWT